MHLAIKVDAPTSPTDPTPAGSALRCRQLDLACRIPLTLNTDKCLVNPVLADDAGFSTGVPVIFTDDGTVEGKVYGVYVWNPAESDVQVEITVLN